MGQYAHDMMRQEFKDNHGFDIGELNDSPGKESANRRKDRTAPTRKAQERQRKREAGLVPVEVWVHQSRREELRSMLAYLTSAK